MMLLRAELLKLRRSATVRTGLFAVFLSVAYSAYQMWLGRSIGEPVRFELLNYVLVFNNTTLVFPATLTLFGGDLIEREYRSDTMKSLRTIPISERKLLETKLLVGLLFAVFFGLMSTFLMFASSLLFLDFPITGAEVGRSLFQVTGMAIFNDLAVMPIVLFSTRKRGGYLIGAGVAFLLGLASLFVGKSPITNFYPITAGYKIVGYEVAHPSGSALISFGVYLALLLCTVLLLRNLPNRGETD